MHRIEVNVQTGVQTFVDLSAAEIAAAQAQKAAWDAEQAAIVKTPTMEEIVAQLRAEIALLKGAA
jgi:hypothetical protein